MPESTKSPAEVLGAAADLPAPKFRIGQTVFYADTDKVTEQLACPDCLGSKKWRLEMPSGDEHDVPCQRCCDGMTYSRIDDLPTLKYDVAKPVARPFVVSNVEVRAKGWGVNAGPEVKYGNSGHGWREEHQLYATEDEALAAAETLATKANEKAEASVERIQLRNIGALKLEDARFDQFQNGLWNAWYAYRDLVEKLDEHLDTSDGRQSSDVLEDLRNDLRWQMDYQARQERPLDKLVEAVAATLKGDASGLAEAYQRLPETLRQASIRGGEA